MSEMLDLLPRIKDLLLWTGLGPAAFADEIGVARPVVSHVLSGRNKVSLEVVQKILNRYQDISSLWMLLGKGEMLKELVRSEPEKEQNEFPSLKGEEGKTAGPGNDDLAVMQKINAKTETEKMLSHPKNRVLRQIVMFYDDGSFESYDKLAN